ncbi:hypothetical protein JDV02_007435 [Purpureocillium takamizusanense]|uniref:Uncharacterized protein n=1 Tax=Purpureocillium takamizusanense TaxID=2060973 RepID=A0A9Q8QI92_9HYPO|nr:uncharacterized protein JDV02_007435 [Purpureocillium takamizusanense]UNI21444.1 hypothetical protein JDV02_007435 [Purpureocillium takamizusanense]
MADCARREHAPDLSMQAKTERGLLGTRRLKLDRWFSTVPDTDPGRETVGHKTVDAPRKRFLLPTACTNPCQAATPPRALWPRRRWVGTRAAANLSTRAQGFPSWRASNLWLALRCGRDLSPVPPLNAVKAL